MNKYHKMLTQVTQTIHSTAWNYRRISGPQQLSASLLIYKSSKKGDDGKPLATTHDKCKLNHSDLNTLPQKEGVIKAKAFKSAAMTASHQLAHHNTMIDIW